MRLNFLLKWYETALKWSQHPKAIFYLALLSFMDASLFPISPNFMILPMSFAKPSKAFYYALITIVGSFLGGILGYAIGYFSYEAIVAPFIEWMGYTDKYQMAMDWFANWGHWAILAGCFTPVFPYKIFTIGAGVLQADFWGFLLVSLVGRSGRFLLLASVVRWGGPRVEPFLRRSLVKLSTPEL